MIVQETLNHCKSGNLICFYLTNGLLRKKKLHSRIFFICSTMKTPALTFRKISKEVLRYLMPVNSLSKAIENSFIKAVLKCNGSNSIIWYFPVALIKGLTRGNFVHCAQSCFCILMSLLFQRQ